MALDRGRWPPPSSLLPPSSSPRNSRSWEEPESSPWRWWNAGRANRGRPACASFPCIPYFPSRPSAPLSLSSQGLPLSLFHSSSLSRFSYSLFLAPTFSHTDTPRSLFTSTRSTLHLIPLSLSPLSSFSIRIYIWHIYNTNEDFVSFSSSFPARSFFFHFQIPLYVSRAGAHANSRAFPLFFLPHFFSPSRLRMCICTYVHAYM